MDKCTLSDARIVKVMVQGAFVNEAALRSTKMWPGYFSKLASRLL